MVDTSKLSASTRRRLEDVTTETSERSRSEAVDALHAAGVRFILVNGSVVGATLVDDLDAAPLDPCEMTDRRIHRYVLERINDEADASRPSVQRDAYDRP